MSEHLEEFRPIIVSPGTAPKLAPVRVGAPRPPQRPRQIPQRLQVLLADAVAISCATLIGSLIYRALTGDRPRTTINAVAVIVVAFLAALTVSGSYGTGLKRLISSGTPQGMRVWHGLILGVVVALLIEHSLTPPAREELELEQVALVALVAVGAIPVARSVSSMVASRRCTRRVLVLGTGRVASAIAARLEWCSNVCVVGMVDDDPRDGFSVVGTETELPELCARHDIDDVLIAFSHKPTHETLENLRRLDDRVSVWVVPRLYELMSWRSTIAELHGIPLLDVAPAQAGRIARAVKRVFDITTASMLLLFLTPVFVAVAVAIKTTSPGPVIFRQIRAGKHGRPFRMYKFRTMRVDAERERAALEAYNAVDGPIFKLRNDPRVTPVGEWLRKTSLDELPQLLNVLRGDMSLVGPRPFPVDESAKITGWATIRFSVPPGMTGLWQVSGRNALSYDDLRHLDYVYAASWSLLWDLRILLRTPASVLHRRGVL